MYLHCSLLLMHKHLKYETNKGVGDKDNGQAQCIKKSKTNLIQEVSNCQNLISFMSAVLNTDECVLPIDGAELYSTKDPLPS